MTNHLHWRFNQTILKNILFLTFYRAQQMAEAPITDMSLAYGRFRDSQNQHCTIFPGTVLVLRHFATCPQTDLAIWQDLIFSDPDALGFFRYMFSFLSALLLWTAIAPAMFLKNFCTPFMGCHCSS
jgi:hypothetical protein